MRCDVLFASLLVGMLAVPALAAAQTCRGTAAIAAASPWQLGAGVAFTEGFTQYDGNGAAGNDQWFAGAQAGRFDLDDVDEGATFVAGLFGVQVPNDASRRIVLCPSVSVGYVSGPNDVAGSGVDLSIYILSGAVNVGYIAVDTGRLQLVPTAGVSVSRQRLTIDTGDASSSESEVLGVLEAGVGVVLSERFTILPTLDVPFGVEDADVGFRIAFTVNFRR